MACICEMIGIACFVAVLLSLSSKAPYHLKMAIYCTGCGAIVLISMPFMLLRPKDYRNALIPAKACVYLCRALGVEMEVRGLENIRVEHGSVIIMNHQSALDLLGKLSTILGKSMSHAKASLSKRRKKIECSSVMKVFFVLSNVHTSISHPHYDCHAVNKKNKKLQAVLKKWSENSYFWPRLYFCISLTPYLWPVIGRATVVAKREILYLPFFGVGAWLWGTLFINRSSKNNSINSLIKESRAINERNCKLLIFPEGTRNSSDTLLPFKKGSFHIALNSNCPIQPVVISKYWFLNSERKIFRSGRAFIHILPEISTEGMTRDNIDELINKCRYTMQKEFIAISQEAKYHNTKKQS